MQKQMNGGFFTWWGAEEVKELVLFGPETFNVNTISAKSLLNHSFAFLSL